MLFKCMPVTWGVHEKSPDLHICRQMTIILGCLGALGLSQSEQLSVAGVFSAE